MKDLKMIAVSAALAFLFSFISGLFGLVSIGTILLRAISGAIIFAALAFGISLLLRRFLPEIYEPQSESSLENKGDLSGTQENEGQSDESVSTHGQPIIDISVGDSEEDSSDEIIYSNTPDSEVELDSNNNLVDEISESELNNSNNSDNNQLPSNIDPLPDMGEFSNTFENIEGLDNNGPGKSGVTTLDIMGEEQDPELVAKALRTMVKRNQEG